MGDKKQKNGQLGIGEINTIRDILVGEQFQKFEASLKNLRQEMDEMRDDFNYSLQEMKILIKQNGKDVKHNMLNKIVDLENRMVKGQEKTNHRMKKDKNESEERLSKLFLKLGKELASK